MLSCRFSISKNWATVITARHLTLVNCPDVFIKILQIRYNLPTDVASRFVAQTWKEKEAFVTRCSLWSKIHITCDSWGIYQHHLITFHACLHLLECINKMVAFTEDNSSSCNSAQNLRTCLSTSMKSHMWLKWEATSSLLRWPYCPRQSPSFPSSQLFPMSLAHMYSHLFYFSELGPTKDALVHFHIMSPG